MNITMKQRMSHTILRAQARLIENRSSIKTYASEKTATAKADELSDLLANYWEVKYAPVVALQLASGRWFIAADLDAIHQQGAVGGYIPYGLEGHWTVSTCPQVANSRVRAA